MSKKWVDKEVYYCPKCRHKWVLTCDRWISNAEHWAWMLGVLLEHDKIIKEKENE